MTKKIYILVLNETHLVSSISDELLSVDGYDIVLIETEMEVVCVFISDVM